MRKFLILIIVTALLVFLGPRIMNGLLGLFGEKPYDIAGTWQITYTIYDNSSQGTYRFGTPNKNGKGDISSEGATVGSYEFKGKSVIFSLKFMDEARDKLDAEFRGVVDTGIEMDVRDSMRGTLKGTRMINGITVETKGDWSGNRI